MTAKIAARQVPPEHQESPLMFGKMPEGIEITGNNRLTTHESTLYKNVRLNLMYAADVIHELKHGERPYTTWADALADLFPREKEYTRAERLQWRDLLADPAAVYDSRRYDTRAAALSLITGQAWDTCTLRGCCQSDWQNCIYRADLWDGPALERLEMEYFNTGTEWHIYDGEDVCCSVYCYEWSDNGIRQEIADAAGVSPEAVKLYKFTGYTKTATYEEV